MAPILACVLVGFVLGVLAGAAATLLIRRRPHVDALTGLPTRTAADAALASLKAGDAVVMIDLDTLKATNDEHGHAAGDEALTAFAAHLSAQVRTNDAVTRWGGDEFLVVLRGSDTNAATVVERIRRSSPTPFSAGIGASLAEADAALLEAKRAGGGRVVRA